MSNVRPPIASFQNEIYLAGVRGERPDLPLTYDALIERARATCTPEAFDYVAGGAGRERTMSANVEAFDRWRIVPRHLRGVAARDFSTSVLGTEMPAPLLFAPIGVQSLVHAEGELASARAAAALGVPYVYSSAASHSLEEVADAAAGGPLWFQLYWPRDPELARSFLRRAEAAGCQAVVVTLDTMFLGWRPRDLAHAFLPFAKGMGCALHFSDPVFRAALPAPPEENLAAAAAHFLQVFSNPGHTWSDLAALRAETPLPFLVKGILTPDDARRARDAGCDGVVVSNHGGRQIDGEIAALDALPSVAEAVGAEMAVLFDSGIRSGADLFKAVALGARAVLVGRPYVWGLALAGEAGARFVARGLLAELDSVAALAGCRSTAEIERDCLRARE